MLKRKFNGDEINCTCSSCQRNFTKYKLLPDQSYGEFILSGTDMSELRYFNAVDCSAWKEAIEILRSQGVSPDLFQALVSCIFDRDSKGGEFSILKLFECPNCFSNAISVTSRNRVTKTIKVASHISWEKLQKKEKENLLLARLHDLRTTVLKRQLSGASGSE